MMEAQNSEITDLSSASETPQSSPTLNRPQQKDMNELKHLSVVDIVKTIPPECFDKNPWKAWSAALMNFVLLVSGYWGIATLPWFCLPPLWILTGTTFCGLFMLGHDCGHYSFAQKRWVNDLAGHLFMTPVLYPFYNWRFQHNSHHANTNKLGGERWRQLQDMLNGKADPVWQPIRAEIYGGLTPKNRWIYEQVRGNLWWLGTTINWWSQITLNVSSLPEKERSKVQISMTIVKVFALILFPTLLVTTGAWGIIKFWLLPWLVFHFWFSTFTLIHHTAPDTIWKTSKEWSAVEAQLSGTIHCNYPRPIEWICHDINYHVPHHIAAAIPFYNLRRAYESLKQNWQPYLRESNFSWSLLREITTQCHLYNSAENRYQSLKEISLSVEQKTVSPS